MIEYTPQRWRSHFFDIKGSMVREIAYRLLVVVIFAGAVSIADHYWTPLAINGQPHALIAPALSLLLVFRTNAANDRFWEGRRLWGGIVNSARNLRRKAEAMLPAELAGRIVDWSITFAWSSRYRLLDETSLGPDSKLSAEDQAAALGSAHVPVYCARRITTLIAEAKAAGQISDIQQQVLDGEVDELVDHLGGCERIDQTPLPFAYAVHLRRSLVLYCVSLPFALVAVFHEWTVLVTLLISYVLIGIEEIGTEIEGPFGRRENDLPLDAICTRLAANLREG